MYIELSVNNILKPMILYVNFFLSSFFQRIISNSCETLLVCFDWIWWLGMSKITEDGTNSIGFLCIVEEHSALSFDGEGEDDPYYGGNNIDGFVY